jgi:CubicO group peptidase (beta-lactamase class C family)
MKKSFIFQVASLILILAFSCTQTTELKETSPITVSVSGERLLRIDRMLQQGIDSGWIAGAVGFIARDGKIVYNKSFGVSNIEAKTPMRTDDIFRIASQENSFWMIRFQNISLNSPI